MIGAGGVLVARAHVETKVPNANRAVIVEHADGSLHTAEAYRTRDGWLHFWCGKYAERGTPDPTPLP